MHLGSRYPEWSHKIVKAILAQVGHEWLWQKKVLDVGCGNGDVAGALFRLGADVLCVDARPHYLKLINQKFPTIKTQKIDLDHEWPFRNQTFDLVLSIDVANHLKNYEQHIRQILSSTKMAVIETSVVNSDDASKELVFQEHRLDPSASYNGFGSIGTAAKIEQIITETGASFRRKDDASINTDPFQYNWAMNNNSEALSKNRRIWFITASADAKPTAQSNSSSQIISPIASIDAAPGNQKMAEVLKPQTRTPVRLPSTNYHRSLRLPRPSPPSAPMASYQFALPKLASKVRLFYNYYEDRDPQRKSEIDFCLQKNIENSLVDIIIVSSDNNPTFDFLFQKVNKISGDNDISIICNADVYFDGSIALIDKMPLKTVYALSRWNGSTLDEKHQDAWIFRGKVENISANFQLGKPGCDGRISQEFSNAGYTVINPSKSIKAYHYHNSNIRNYTEEERVAGPYLFVEPSIL